jgi:hypothetical protein
MFLVLGAFVMRDAHAGEVMLDVTMTVDQEKLGLKQLVATEDKSTEFRVEGKVRLLVSPHVTASGGILLSMRVEEPAGSRWVEVEEPRIMVENGNEGTVKVTSPKGRVIEIAIRPRRM